MAKMSARKRKEVLQEVKEQMVETGDATVVDLEKQEFRTIFSKTRNVVGVAPRESGPTKKQAVTKKKRELIRQERARRYQQIVSGTYESGLKFEHTSEEQYGALLRLSDDTPPFWLSKQGLEPNSCVLLINSSSHDVGNEGRFVQVLTPGGHMVDVRASWLEPVS